MDHDIRSDRDHAMLIRQRFSWPDSTAAFAAAAAVTWDVRSAVDCSGAAQLLLVLNLQHQCQKSWRLTPRTQFCFSQYFAKKHTTV